MACAACAAGIERTAGGLPGVSDAVVNYAAGTLTVTYDPLTADLETIARAVEKQGYSVIGGGPPAAGEDARGARGRRNDLVIALVFAVPLAVYAMAGMFGADVPPGGGPMPF
jgi:cation transport ATPase